MKRCPRGTRRDKKTGECKDNNARKIRQVRDAKDYSSSSPKVASLLRSDDSPKPKTMKRCPKGSRRNKKTGECDPTVVPLPQKPKSPSTPLPPKSYLMFHSKSKDIDAFGLPKDAMRRLSNFSMDSVEYDGHVYPSVEHAYQAQKYVCSNKPELVKMFYDGTLDTAEKAKSAGGKGGMKKHGAALDFACWSDKRPTNQGGMVFDSKGERIMQDLIESKVKRNPEIRDILKILRKNNVGLVHFSRMDMTWGAHMNEAKTEIIRGENKLGDIYDKIKL